VLLLFILWKSEKKNALSVSYVYFLHVLEKEEAETDARRTYVPLINSFSSRMERGLFPSNETTHVGANLIG
jgi:hypothetical protein